MPSLLRRLVAPPLHRDIDAVLAIGMAKRIDDRYPSARAMVDDLDRAVRGDLDEPTRLRARELASITADAATVVAEV